MKPIQGPHLPSVLSSFASIIVLAACCSAPDARLTRIDPFEKVLPESSWLHEYTEIEDVAAGENAVFQFALRSVSDMKDVKLEVSALKNSEGNSIDDVRVGFVDFVHVGRTTPDPARDAIRSATLMYPDPICDDSRPRDIPGGKTQPLWVSVKVPREAAPGIYSGEVSVKGKGISLKGSFSLKVWDVVLEEPMLDVTNWFRSDEKAFRFFSKDGEMGSEAYWEYIRAVARQMKECHQNTVMVPVSAITSRTGDEGFEFDFSNFDQMVGIFMEEGVLKRLEVSHIGGRMSDWSSQFGVKVPGQEKLLPIENPEARSYYAAFIPALNAHLEEKGWDSIYCQHIADEPTRDNYQSYIAIARFVKSLAPKTKIIEACHSHNLADVVDIWVPQLNFYADDYDFYCERQALGDEVWFYTCLAPQGNYANRFIEQPLLKTRLLHWIGFRYGATGYLHWGLNAWRVDNPWYETTGINTESGNVLPGGDCWIVYPGQGRLYGSIRLEAMRDGVADYTLLKMLERKDPALAKEICRQTVYGWTTYDMSADHFRTARRAILQALCE